MNNIEMKNILVTEIQDMLDKLKVLRASSNITKEDLDTMEEMLKWIKKALALLEEVNGAIDEN